ncbi:hypothetical protein [Ewingella americana]|uniref:Uncharacterized protein n=1 Tax=Ewingella americana TaxID=41202 RepID=A0A502GDS5_9GAMM|nr:hypothetical protein [Ewingella americana]TPG60065.1 hypothetical protein EAH77_15980 [Ewingella americana]
MSIKDEVKQAILDALNIPESLSDAVIAIPSTEPVKVWYEPSKCREIIEFLKEKLKMQVPVYIEFKTRDPLSAKVFDVRGYVSVQNIVHLPKAIINARSDVRLYMYHNELILPPEVIQ